MNKKNIKIPKPPKLQMVNPLKSPTKEALINGVLILFDNRNSDNAWKIADIIELKLMQGDKLFVVKNDKKIEISKMSKTQLENLYSFLIMANNQTVSSEELIKIFIPLCDFPSIGRSYLYAIKRLEKLNYFIWEEVSDSNETICYGVDLKGNSFMLGRGTPVLYKLSDEDQMLPVSVIKQTISVLKDFHKYNPFA